MAWRISRQAIFCICIEIVTIQRKMRENLEVTNKVCIFAAEKKSPCMQNTWVSCWKAT
jgi:hypothetical protein